MSGFGKLLALNFAGVGGLVRRPGLLRGRLETVLGTTMCGMQQMLIIMSMSKKVPFFYQLNV
jgi:hypothetical protein